MLLTTTLWGAEPEPKGQGGEVSAAHSGGPLLSTSGVLSGRSSHPLTQADERKVGGGFPACGIDGGHSNPLCLGWDGGATAGSLLADQLLTFNLEPESIPHLHKVPRGLWDEEKKGLLSPI